jgi:hypothetical protein
MKRTTLPYPDLAPPLTRQNVSTCLATAPHCLTGGANGWVAAFRRG